MIHRNFIYIRFDHPVAVYLYLFKPALPCIFHYYSFCAHKSIDPRRYAPHIRAKLRIHRVPETAHRALRKIKSHQRVEIRPRSNNKHHFRLPPPQAFGSSKTFSALNENPRSRKKAIRRAILEVRSANNASRISNRCSLVKRSLARSLARVRGRAV